MKGIGIGAGACPWFPDAFYELLGIEQAIVIGYDCSHCCLVVIIYYL
jgi:hypothetical protein